VFEMSFDFETIHQELIASGLNDLILKLDHIAYRVKKGERQKKMAEMLNLVPYQAYKSFTVKHANAITSTIKLAETLPVIVISEGMTSDSIVEKYCQKYGSRVHHLAYLVRDIEQVVEIQKSRGLEFTSEKIIGSEKEGIKQIFTVPTETTNHIIEYIQRFGDFDGFFTPNNIAGLMQSTEKLGEA
jgi:4-hydroxyphenylpyruvate dioxygenase-like putative hemolysin